jgi:hypothetical protein
MIHVKQITFDEAINHEMSDYNPRYWSEAVNRYARREAKFYTSIQASKYGIRRVYAIYKVDDLVVIQLVSYSSSITSYPMESFILIEDKWINKMPFRFPKNEEGKTRAKHLLDSIPNLMVGDIPMYI